MAAASFTDSNTERDEYEDKVRFFNSYLHGNQSEWETRIDKALGKEGAVRYRIPLELREIDEHSPGIAAKVLADPVKYLNPWEDALLGFLKDLNEKAQKNLRQPLRLDIKGAFGRNRVTPRGMTCKTLHRLMCVEGLVTKSGMSKPKIVQSMHVRKQEDGHVVMRDQRDATSFREQPMAGMMPKVDAEGNELVLEIGLSVYKDEQVFTLQEATDQAPPGQIPRSVEVVCDGELADKVKPGDRVQVTGVYQGFPGRPEEFTTGVWGHRLVATSVMPIKELDDAPFVTQDIRNIRAIGERKDVFELLARSFAPSICGHESVKAGLLLQLIGGTEKNLDNGTHLRGDINVLLIGDPSCGKSQMLRFVMNTAPLAISTTGRGSSGVGLTAALSREPGSRDFNIEAGAMVLADRGIICIDEFDKMNQADRVAIHEAMEQQCVTIAKAGMHVTLNARCSVTAAANPIYGTFDPRQDLAKNIGMPDSLLSRFDLVYVVRDLTDEEIDRKIATQVLSQCRQRAGGDGRRRGVEQVHSSIIERRHQADRSKTQEPTEVFEKASDGEDGKKEVLTVDFLRKYIRYCKRFTPLLTPEAHDAIAEKYTEMRTRFQVNFADKDPNQEQKPRIAVTTRTLEALIRLSTAHAKLKLQKDEVTKENVCAAYELMLRAREEAPTTQSTAVVEEAPEDGGDEGGGARGSKRTNEEGDKMPAKRKKTGITQERYRVLETLVGRSFARVQVMAKLHKDDLLASINSELSLGEEEFTEEEFLAGLEKLDDNNKIILSEDGYIDNVS